MISQYHLPLPQKESMAAEDFFSSAANEQARQWLVRRDPVTWPSHALVLWGPEGAGKTHLLSVWAAQRQAVFVQPEDDTLPKIIAGDGSPAFVLDNADSVVGVAEKEEWLQHFFNATKEAGVPFLMATRRPPAQWGLRLRDIETRLKSCLSVEIFEPDDDLMRGLLLKLFADRQLRIESGVIDYLAARLERTGSALISAVEVLDEAALETGRKISTPFAQRALSLFQEAHIQEKDNL